MKVGGMCPLEMFGRAQNAMNHLPPTNGLSVPHIVKTAANMMVEGVPNVTKRGIMFGERGR